MLAGARRMMAARLRLPVSVLVLDVDGTLTLRDTLEDLVHAAIEGDARRSQLLTHSAESAKAAEQVRLKRERWLELKEAYSRPYAAFLQRMVKEEESVPRLQESFQEEETVEYDSVRRVEASRVLEGLSKEEWTQLGRRMGRSGLLRPGAAELIRRVRACAVHQQQKPETEDAVGAMVEIHALSSNWCKDYLAGVLEGLVDDHHIRANELVYSDQTDLSTGEMKMQVVSAFDKQRYIKQLRDQSNGVMFVGDTLNDLLALLEADYGVLLGNSRSVVSVLRKHRIELRPLSESSKQEDLEPARGRVVWQANDWSEVSGWLFSAEGKEE